MSKHVRWLLGEIDRWTAEKIVTPAQAAQLRARYAPVAPPVSWGLILFFALGAVIVGLGVILLFAYNWDAIPKFAKLALIFAAVIAAHAGGLRLRAHDDWRAQLGEGLSLLGTMAFGAGIWLVAQVYHIDEHFPNGFLIWALGALVLAWALQSIGQAVVATILLAIWGGLEAISFSRPADISSLLVVGAIGPLAWRTRSALLLTVGLAALYWLVIVGASHWHGVPGVFGNLFALSVLLIAVDKFPAAERFGDRGPGVLRFFGWTGFLLGSYCLGFADAADDVLGNWAEVSPGFVTALAYRWILFALALAAWGWLAARRWKTVRREEWLCPIALVYAQGLVLFNRSDDVLVAIVFNLVCLGIAAAWMIRGCREGALRPTVLGSVLLAAIVFARYFDLFDDLFVRGVIFVVFGGVLFAEGFYYRKLRRAEAEGGER